MNEEILGNITLYNCDCMDYMATCKDNEFDLAIVDPPYGIGNFNSHQNTKKDKRDGKIWGLNKYKKIEWNNNIPGNDYFMELQRISKNHIIFGFQFYFKYLWNELKGIIIHDFKDTSFNMSHADVAITNLQKRTTLFSYLWSGFKKEYKRPSDKNRIHPCEKPVSLYEWLLHNYAKPGQKIFDSHFGSLSIGIACHNLGFELTACELDKDYYEAAKKRLKIHQMQKTIFDYIK